MAPSPIDPQKAAPFFNSIFYGSDPSPATATAAQTIDAKIAELIDSKAGLAARALDGSEDEVSSSADVQLEALVALLTDALTASR